MSVHQGTSRTGAVRRACGHGAIVLTSYPSSARVGVDVTADNAAMDGVELVTLMEEDQAHG